MRRQEEDRGSVSWRHPERVKTGCDAVLIGDLPDKPASLIHGRILTPLSKKKAHPPKQDDSTLLITAMGAVPSSRQKVTILCRLHFLSQT